MSMPLDTMTAARFELTQREVNLLTQQITTDCMEWYADRYASLSSRHIQRGGNRLAVEMLEHDLLEIGEGTPRFKVKRIRFGVAGMKLENVEARLKGKKCEGIVLVSAHLDCTAAGEPGYQPGVDESPGADDDASGMAGVLAAARAVVELVSKFPNRPRREIRFVLFNAEEHRQKGSRNYARRARNGCEPIRAVFQMDMIGHQGDKRRIFELHTGLVDCKGGRAVPRESVAEESRLLGELVKELALVVSPKLERAEIFPLDGCDTDPAQDLSDHTSFHRKNYPACLISEDFFGPGRGDPNRDYHLRDDIIENLDFEYAADIARAVAAAAWYAATRDWPPMSSGKERALDDEGEEEQVLEDAEGEGEQ